MHGCKITVSTLCSHPQSEFKQVISKVITVAENVSMCECMSVISMQMCACVSMCVCVSIRAVWVMTRSCLSFS